MAPEGLELIQDSGWRLLRMVDDILDHARGLVGKLKIAPTSVDWPVFLRAVEIDAARVAGRNANSFVLRRKGLQLRRVRFDEARLRQVLDNLIANAARHTAKGRIELDCIVASAGEDAITIDFHVMDSGEGIAFDDQERIFLPFERGKGTVSRYGGKGLGMGLAISRQLVEMMGGRLTVESRPGEGACFRFQVLAEREQDEAAETTRLSIGRAYDGPQRTLLLVDDDEGGRRALATFLRSVGFHVVEAQSGRSALNACSETMPPDLVLTDLFMADGDGWSVLAAMARRNRAIPVVSISSAPSERPAQFPEGLCFARHLMKPLDHSKVLQCISDLIGEDGAQEPPAERAPDARSASLERPSAAMLAALSHMVDEGRVSDIQTWAEALKAAEPNCAGFADEVRAATIRLDFQALEALSAE